MNLSDQQDTRSEGRRDVGIQVQSAAEWDRNHPAPVETFTPEPVAAPATPDNFGRQLTWFAGIVVVLGLALLLWYTGQEREKQRWVGFDQARVVAVGAMRRAWLEPAPTVRKGPKVNGMSTLIVEGAGDSSYNGTYSQVGGEIYDGQPVYRLGGSPTGKCLYLYATVQWCLSVVPGDDPAFVARYSGGSTLPANPWTTEAAGTAPAPSLTEYIADPALGDPDAFDWPYEYVWWDGAELPASPLAPCRATIGGVSYIVLPVTGTAAGTSIVKHGFACYNETTKVWSWTPVASGVLLANFDIYQSGGVFDAGDDTNVWLCGGAYDDSGTAKMEWRKYSLVPGTSATIVGTATVVELPSLNVTNMAQVGATEFRFLNVPASTPVGYYSYTAGDATATLLYNAASIVTGCDVKLGATSRPDVVLFKDQFGAVSAMINYILSSGQHLVAQRKFTDISEIGSGIVLTGPKTYLQTWGTYAAGDYVAGDIGTTSGSIAHVHWKPGIDQGVIASPFVSHPVTRRWYVDGTPLIVSGWSSAAQGYRPFVCLIELGASRTLSPGFAAATGGAYAPTFVRRLNVPFAAPTGGAYSPTFVARRTIYPGFAAPTGQAYTPAIYPASVGTPGAVDADIAWVRVRIGA